MSLGTFVAVALRNDARYHVVTLLALSHRVDEALRTKVQDEVTLERVQRLADGTKKIKTLRQARRFLKAELKDIAAD